MPARRRVTDADDVAAELAGLAAAGGAQAATSSDAKRLRFAFMLTPRGCRRVHRKWQLPALSGDMPPRRR